MAVIKGLHSIREKNNAESAYHKWVDIEDMGVVIYTPLEITNPDNFIDPEKNKTMYDNIANVTLKK